MAKNKDSKTKLKAKKSKKTKGIKFAVTASGGPSIKFPPEIGDRLAAAGAELQSRAEAVFAQWLNQASLTLRKNGVQTIVDDIKAAGKQIRHTDKIESFEKVARELASNVAKEITRFAMSATIARSNAPRPAAPAKPAAKTAAKPPVKAGAKPATKPAARPVPLAVKAAAKPAAKSPAKRAPKAAAKPAAKAAAKPATKAPAAKAPATKAKAATAKPAPRRRAPRPASRPTAKK